MNAADENCKLCVIFSGERTANRMQNSPFSATDIPQFELIPLSVKKYRSHTL